MDENEQRAAFHAALTTEHFVLQTATSTTYTEASARSSLYVMALSSSLVAIGFMANTPSVLIPFISVILPAIFLLGVLTVMRLIETGLESMQYLRGIARIRAHYRTLGTDAQAQFAAAHGRWPEVPSPALRLGPLLAFFGTTATMIAVINNLIGGTAIALLVGAVHGSAPRWACASAGVATAVLLTWLFYVYQSWRFAEFDGTKANAAEPSTKP
jgi:hypothetical protein